MIMLRLSCYDLCLLCELSCVGCVVVMFVMFAIYCARCGNSLRLFGTNVNLCSKITVLV